MIILYLHLHKHILYMYIFTDSVSHQCESAHYNNEDQQKWYKLPHSQSHSSYQQLHERHTTQVLE